MDRRAKLLGLDAPAQANVSVTLEAAIAAVEKLEREADHREAETPARAIETCSLPVCGAVAHLDIELRCERQVPGQHPSKNGARAHQ
jgi:hypothetical protein